MPRSASIPASLLAFLSLSLTIYLFIIAEFQQDRNILLGFLAGEGIFVTWLAWSFSQSDDTAEPEPIPVPRARQPEVMPAGPTYAPQPRPPYQHRPLQPTRPPSRASDPLPSPSVSARRNVSLPPLPDLTPPQPGQSNTRIPTTTLPRNTRKPLKPVIRLGDLLPPAPPKIPPPTIPTTPRPQPTPSSQGRPKRPRKYAKFAGNSADLPTKIALSELKISCDILTLGYACASSDGPVTTEEDDHLQGWSWCVIDNTSDKDAEAFAQALNEAANLAKNKGKQRLEAITMLAESIRATGVKKLIQSAAELCGEIVEHDGRLQPGEFATLAAAFKGLGVKSTKATKIATQLLANDDEISEMLAELEIYPRTPTADRELKLSLAWSRENGRMQAVSDAGRREEMRHRMELIQKIRDIHREMDIHNL